MTLSIAAPSFSRQSETFIRAHVRTILPDRTVLICEDGRGSETLGLPVLSNIDPYPNPCSALDRLGRAARFQWSVHVARTLRGENERRLREFFEQHRVTHCLAQFGPTGCKLTRATRRAGVKLYVHFHGYDATSLPREARWRREYRRLFRQAAGVIAPSQFILERLVALGCPQEKLHVSSCGIAPDQFPPSTHEAGQVLAVGRFVEKKAPLTTVRAFATAAGEIPGAHLHMVGDGPLLAPAQALAADLGVTGRITFHGAQPHDAVRALLARASLFVQHSVTAPNGDTEGLPVAILEAMASGVPVVSTRHSGIPEAVQEGETGLLVEEHDTEGMARAMAHLLSHPDLAAAIGQAAVPHVRAAFSHEATAARLRKIMEIAT
ncbi:MAG: glycosyl transferase family 1 [Mameliella sp.]|nr:glycosyl transferase family 1 [Mameliella sp.]|tara:strand:+ start:12481 stop:13617 length:1137 start_codon:yes stop_codon:yes gene_type:complete